MLMDEFILDEKIRLFMSDSAYRVYDMDGNVVGAVRQTGTSAGAKGARLIMRKGLDQFQKFKLDILSADGTLLGCVYRDGYALADVIVENKDGEEIMRSKMRSGYF